MEVVCKVLELAALSRGMNVLDYLDCLALQHDEDWLLGVHSHPPINIRLKKATCIDIEIRAIGSSELANAMLPAEEDNVIIVFDFDDKPREYFQIPITNVEDGPLTAIQIAKTFFDIPIQKGVSIEVETDCNNINNTCVDVVIDDDETNCSVVFSCATEFDPSLLYLDLDIPIR